MQLPLTSDDIQACIELASDGISLHLKEQDKLDLIHRVMYAVAEAAQNNQSLMAQLENDASKQYCVYLQHVDSGKK